MPDLQTAIAQAAEQLKAEAAGTAPPEKETPASDSAEVEVEVETVTDPESDDEPEMESELSDSERDEANRLYKALRNPQTAGPIVAALAAQAGLHLTSESTKTEVREAKKSIQDKVAEALGDQYKFLAPQLGKAIESALEVERETHSAEIQQIRQNQIERDVITAYERLNRETKGESKKLEARMTAL
ncbi:MAG TPA: hypothetical protein VFJ43_04395, partial [Bacteroidia bacterium]|nr:hypothetical protein [Bacteroidia bacterium]